MKVKEAMSTDVITVGERTPFKEIVQLMLRYDISGVPVVDDQGMVVGVVSEGDLMAKEAYPPARRRRGALRMIERWLSGDANGWREKATGLCARDVMSDTAIIAEPNDSVQAAAERMTRNGVKRLPVIDGGTLVGMITRHDVLRVLGRSDGDLKRAIEDFLVHRCMYVPPEHEIALSVDKGIVRLEGTVYYESDTRVIESMVRALDGVVDVENHLAYRKPDPKTITMSTAP